MAKVFYMGVVERGLNGSFGVYFPDLPGCVSAADTFEETVAGGQEALELHLDGMREDGLTIPEPSPVTAFDPDDYPGSDVFRIVMFPVESETAGGDPTPAVRINITMNLRLLNRVDAAAQANGLTRSGLLALASRQWINANGAPR
ncbi:MAG: type II toxin-antitoxin system HicB family antitoxin [Brevundimonas sp.]|nr:type II toxin-antitoxin system HicB family antitoxin [Brevundimonas sp.]